MATQRLDVRSVCVIGAGVSGVSAAVHLKRAGLEVTVYERSKRAGGIWYGRGRPASK
jgi:cation diffusion facilitator CzcD-associated flavoprotein CzcO